MRMEETERVQAFPGKPLTLTELSREEGTIFVVKIVSFANPISCQLNPTLWNILKFTQNTRGGRRRWMELLEGKKK